MSTTQDTLDRHESVVVELDDGTRLIEHDPDGDDVSYRIETPYDSMTLDDERRARLWIAVYGIVDGFKLPGPPSSSPSIPVPVVVAGRAEIMSYLHAVRGWRSDDIAETFDVGRKTVWDHWSRVRTQAEDQGYLP